MSQKEAYHNRDLTYSAWHRAESIGCYVGVRHAYLLSMVDIDVALYVEYEDHNKEPLALIETARDVGQDFKSGTVTYNLAKRANLQCFLVLYSISDSPNPADNSVPDIERFRIKQLWPLQDSNWQTVLPKTWARILLDIHQHTTNIKGLK